jgi:hypothetical protein
VTLCVVWGFRTQHEPIYMLSTDCIVVVCNRVLDAFFYGYIFVHFIYSHSYNSRFLPERIVEILFGNTHILTKRLGYTGQCMRNLMTVEEAKGVCKDRSEWREELFACIKWKRV